MATDFFERQAAAKKSTAWLIAMFAVAVVGLVAATTLVAYLAVAGYYESAESLRGRPAPIQIPLGVGLATFALVFCGTAFKSFVLRLGGGSGVAESLGGKPVLAEGASSEERRLLNLVEEMAIASGVPAPPVYLIDERGINAFAAGYSPSDAVIGVTRGAVEALSRDELQGVIAHEFSHILNGDMRMSIRLIGVLHGILLIGLLGQLILRFVFYGGGTHGGSRSGGGESSGKGGAAILGVLAVGAALVVIGSVGSLIGGLIKAAVSRQREYLADASAIQFTRNPSGIAGALKRIGAAPRASRIDHPRAPEMSHMYFSQGVWEGFSGLMATHPPLRKRILAIEPTWNGEWGEPVGVRYPGAVEAAAAFAGGAADNDLDVAVDRAAEQVGEPTQAHHEYAADLIRSIPSAVVESAREPYGARAVLYAMLLDADRSVRQKQYNELREIAEPDVLRLMLKLLPDMDRLDDRTRLPLIDMVSPALARLSQSQYRRFSRCFRALIVADERLSMFEWVLSQALMRHLRPKFESVRSPITRYYALGRLAEECSVVLSALAWSGHAGANPEASFAQAARVLPELKLQLLPREQCGLGKLRDALATLATVAAKHRGRVVDAAAEAIRADARVSVAEAELLRGVSDLLDCPMPPLLPGQKLAA